MLHRRTLLQALALLVLAPDAMAQTSASLAQLSSALTGYPEADPDALARLMHAFATPARRASLRALAALAATTPPSQLDAAIAGHKLDKTADDLVAAWYSGMVDGKVVLYTQALVWRAMAFSKPMGVCGGVTGYWAEPWTPT